MNNEEIASVCHEVNAAYCRALGDLSQLSWADAPAWQKDSAIDGVDAHRGDPDMSPAASHEAWMKQKTADDWKYGREKDPIAKTHPCYMAYECLPQEQRAKDYIFKAIVNALV